jgi:hypothetical protein
METAQTTTKKWKMPWDDDPRLGRYIDDNALFMRDAVTRGHLSGKHASYHFFLASAQPLEWAHKTQIKFLLQIADEYGFELNNFKTERYAFAEEYEEPIFDEKTGKPIAGFEEAWEKYSKEYKEYEKCRKKYYLGPDDFLSKECRFPIQPRKYGGAYKWALDEIKKKSSEGKLFAKIFADKFDRSDLEEAVKISDWMLPINEPEDSELLYAKKVCNDIVNWTSFEFVFDEKTAGKLKDDLNIYLDKFINNGLAMPSREKRIGEVLVLQNQNIYTFNKHKELMLERLREMHENFGNAFVFENPFGQIARYDGDNHKENLKERYAARQFLFKHAIFAFEKLGYIRILTLGNNWHYSEEVEDLRDTAKIQLLPPFFKELGVAPKQTNLYFDDEKSRLFVRGVEVIIQKNSDQYHALRVMFADPKELPQEWFFDDIAERIDRSRPQERVKRYYNAIYQIGLKLTAKGFPDFFITTKYSAKIDQKYLS